MCRNSCSILSAGTLNSPSYGKLYYTNFTTTVVAVVVVAAAADDDDDDDDDDDTTSTEKKLNCILSNVLFPGGMH